MQSKYHERMGTNKKSAKEERKKRKRNKEMTAGAGGVEAKRMKRTKKTHSATYTEMLIIMVVDAFMVSIIV